MNEKTTDSLTHVLRAASPERLNDFFDANEARLLPQEKPFSTYMRALFRQKGVKQQDVFLLADISEGYGYKLISEEKRTRQRDVILRLCLAAHFSLDETQRALKVYGFSPLYPRLRRDAILIVAINTGKFEISAVDALLTEYAMPPLYACRESD